MPEVDISFVVDSPLTGTVHCASEQSACDYADMVDGQPFIQVWCEGIIVDEYQMGRE